MKEARQSNIELLRIFAISGIIVLHYNNPSMGGGFLYASKESINCMILYILESLFVCGVNLFVLISGYFLSKTQNRSIWKPIMLITQVVVFREMIYLVNCIVNHDAFSFKIATVMLIPANYFVILYCVTYIISPYLNGIIERLQTEKLRSFVGIIIVLFSVYPTLVDVLGEIAGKEFSGLSSIGLYGSQYGYSIVNFVLMYILGAYLRKDIQMFHNWSITRLIVIIGLVVVALTAWACANDHIGYFKERSAWEYCNPLVVLEAVLLFVLFYRIRIGSIGVVNKAAEGGFTVFLTHSAFLPYLKIEYYASRNIFLMVIHLLVSVIAIYCCGLFIHFIYHCLIDWAFKLLEKKFGTLRLKVDL